MCECEEKLVLSMMTDEGAKRYRESFKSPVYQAQCGTCGRLFVCLLQIKTPCSDLLPFALAAKRREDKKRSAAKKKARTETTNGVDADVEEVHSDKTELEIVD